MTHHSALIIDDDPLFQIVAEEILYAAGLAAVKTADDGHSGLQAIADHPGEIDLVICDLQMPSLDGVGVIRELAALKFDGTVVIVSSEDSNLVGVVCKMAEMLGVRIVGALKKPLDAVALQAMLATQVFSPAPAPETPVTRAAVEQAIAQRLILPYYQPQVSLRTGRLSGFEVLARITADDGTIRNCMGHLRAAESFGLMTDLTMAIVDQVIEDAHSWQGMAEPFRLAINLSPTSVEDVSLPDMLVAKFSAAGFDMSLITLEVTEDRLLERNTHVMEVLARLRLAGFRLSIDDFGAGSTSAEQLKLFPFNELKIDKQFVQSAGHDAFSRVTMESSIAMASMLGMTVVAEGVETEAARAFAAAAGADEAQGFIYAQAMPAPDVLDWSQAFRTRAAKVA